MRILVVDDAAPMRFLLSRYLTSLGHEVVDVAAGEEVPAALDAHAVDAVFTDVVMPGWSGWDVLAHVRTVRPALPVVLLSGWDAGELRATTTHEPDAIIDKPASLDRIREVLEKIAPTR